MEKFYAMLDNWALSPSGNTQEMEQALWQHYGVEKAVLALDMSGFSRTVRRYGILHYLAMVRRMHLISEPAVLRCDGEVVKFEADNVFAVFPTVEAAILASAEIVRCFNIENEKTPDNRDIHVSIGIAWGKILLIPSRDYFGDAVNIACKLGEDLAQADEILVDDSAWSRVKDPQSLGMAAEGLELSVSGLALKAWRIFPGG